MIPTSADRRPFALSACRSRAGSLRLLRFDRAQHARFAARHCEHSRTFANIREHRGDFGADYVRFARSGEV